VGEGERKEKVNGKSRIKEGVGTGNRSWKRRDRKGKNGVGEKSATGGGDDRGRIGAGRWEGGEGA
jgi:hypothetical protein